MKIAFCAQHKYWGGMNNNGGTLTILKAANALRKMKQKVYVVANSDKCTWMKHPKPLDRIPKDVNVCIAVSCTDIEPMLQSMPKKALSAVWLRGWERWRHKGPEIVKMVSRVDRVFVNSVWLEQKLAESNIGSTVIHQGIDENQWPCKGEWSEKITIGCLYHKMESKRWKDFVKLAKICGKGFRYVAYGANRCRDKFISKYYLLPTHKQLVKLYNMCHFWFAPSVLEGLANPPMEAVLCGAAVIASAKRSGGTMDWLSHAHSGYTYHDVEEVAEWLQSPGIIIRDRLAQNAYSNIINNIWGREDNMKKLVEVLS